MDINTNDIELIVKQVISSMNTAPAAQAPQAPKACATCVPEKARVAMLTKLETFELQEYPIPKLGDGDILVKVEGCGVCGTDAHEYKRDPFGFIVRLPFLFGHGIQLFPVGVLQIGESAGFLLPDERADFGIFRVFVGFRGDVSGPVSSQDVHGFKIGFHFFLPSV